MDIRQSKRRRFAHILNYVRENRHLSISELASLLRRPKSTVSMWVAGRRLPTKKDLGYLCSRLNIDYEAVFMKDSIGDAYFQDQVVGFDALQTRYMDVRTSHDEFRALYLATHAGAAMHYQLVTRGFSAITTLDKNLRCVVSMENPPCYVSVDCLGEHGIGFTVYDKSREKIFPWHLLVKTNLDLLVDFLHSLDKQ